MISREVPPVVWGSLPPSSPVSTLGDGYLGSNQHRDNCQVSDGAQSSYTSGWRQSDRMEVGCQGVVRKLVTNVSRREKSRHLVSHTHRVQLFSTAYQCCSGMLAVFCHSATVDNWTFAHFGIVFTLSVVPFVDLSGSSWQEMANGSKFQLISHFWLQEGKRKLTGPDHVRRKLC